MSDTFLEPVFLMLNSLYNVPNCAQNNVNYGIYVINENLFWQQ